MKIKKKFLKTVKIALQQGYTHYILILVNLMDISYEQNRNIIFATTLIPDFSKLIDQYYVYHLKIILLI